MQVLRFLNWALAGVAVILTIVGIASVRADPASKFHVNAAVTWIGLRIVYLIALTSLAFPEDHRAGSACKKCERLGAHSRVLAVLVVAALGVVVAVEALSGTLSGEMQIAATLAVVLYNLCCWETVLLDSPAQDSVGTLSVRPFRSWTHTHGYQSNLIKQSNTHRCCARWGSVVDRGSGTRRIGTRESATGEGVSDASVRGSDSRGPRPPQAFKAQCEPH